MKKLQRILLAILGIQLLLAVIVFWPKGSAQSAGSPLLEGLAPAGVTHITIDDRDGNHLSLTREGDGWVLDEAGNFPASADKIEPVLEKLSAIKTNRLVTQTSASHQRLEVAEDKFQRKVQLTLDGGTQLTLFVGSSAGARATHVRLQGQDEVYLTGEFSPWEIATSASSWIDPSYVTLQQDQITSLKLENANGDFELTRDGEGNWSLLSAEEGEQLDGARVSSIISRLTNLGMTEPVGTEEQPQYGFQSPNATITITTNVGNAIETHVISVGAKDSSGNNYFVRYSGSPYIVKVSSANLEDLVTQTREGWLIIPPTPTPGE